VTDRPAYKYGDKIRLNDAVAIYAERDMREHDDIRIAKARARDRIMKAVGNGRLQPASKDGKMFLIETFVSWAILSKVDGKPIKLIDEAWRMSFEGIYEAPAVTTVHTFTHEAPYQYSDEQILCAIQHAPVPEPSGEAPQEWVEAFGIAKFLIDSLRKRNAYLEDRLGKLSKAGRSKGL